MIQTKAELSKRSMDKFRKQFGDTTNQALLRLAVSAGRECALLTQPYGSSKKKIQDSIKHGAEANIAAIPATLFNRIEKSRNPAFKFSRGWVHLNNGQILKSGSEIWDFIEDNRMPNGRVKWLPHRQKAIARKDDFKDVMVRRRKLAGVTKGSWLGAHQALAKKIRGSDKPRLGKNFMNWAQKHMDKGDGEFRGKRLGKSEARLVSDAPATKDKRIFSKDDAKKAVKRAWKKTLGWYRIQCRLKYSK